MKKTILIDLDGVLNTYNGKYDETYIPTIKTGAYEFIKNLANDFNIKIFTSRNLLLTSQWLIENNLAEFVTDVTNHKEPSFLIIDDRCLNFQGDYEHMTEQIYNFKVWYHK